jgi:hypothetical protein
MDYGAFDHQQALAREERHCFQDVDVDAEEIFIAIT